MPHTLLFVSAHLKLWNAIELWLPEIFQVLLAHSVRFCWLLRSSNVNSLLSFQGMNLSLRRTEIVMPLRRIFTHFQILYSFSFPKLNWAWSVTALVLKIKISVIFRCINSLNGFTFECVNVLCFSLFLYFILFTPFFSRHS